MSPLAAPMGKIRLYFLATRPQFLPAIALPVAVGASFAYRSTGAFSPPFFALSLFAALCYHAGMNVLNDYFDFKNGTDNINERALTPFTGGSLFIQKGLITPEQTLSFGLILVALGSVAGLYLAYMTAPLLLVIGALGLFLGYSYSAPPLSLASRGLGEATVGVSFGVLTVPGSYLVQTGGLSWTPFFASLPVSFLITALLYVNEFPDFEADQKAGKLTLVVRLGKERARYGIIPLIAGAYLSLAAAVVLGFLPGSSLIALLSAIPALKSAAGLLKNPQGSRSLIPSIKSIILADLSAGALLAVSALF